MRKKSWPNDFQMVKIDHLKIIWTSFSNKPLKFGQIFIQKLLGFTKTETNGKDDVQINKNYGFEKKILFEDADIKIQFFLSSLHNFFRFLKQGNKKSKFQPRKDQKNGTSKNEPKSRLRALNQKLWPFFDFFRFWNKEIR